MQSNVEMLTKKLVNEIHNFTSSVKCNQPCADFGYAEIVRAVTGALASVNETHRQTEH